MDLCPKNIIIEDRGVIIGLMYFILRYYPKIRDKKIIIADGRIRKIIKYLFYDLEIKKKGIGIVVNIRNSNYEGVVINHYNNLRRLQTNNVYILPWGNKDNPMVMFRVNNKYNKDMKEYDEVIKYHHDKFEERCKTLKYDLILDNSIINLYSDLYYESDPAYISDFIHCYLHDYIDCNKQTIQNPVYLPYITYVDRYVPQYVPYEIEKECPVCPDPPKCPDKSTKFQGASDKPADDADSFDPRTYCAFRFPEEFEEKENCVEGEDVEKLISGLTMKTKALNDLIDEKKL